MQKIILLSILFINSTFLYSQRTNSHFLKELEKLKFSIEKSSIDEKGDMKLTLKVSNTTSNDIKVMGGNRKRGAVDSNNKSYLYCKIVLSNGEKIDPADSSKSGHINYVKANSIKFINITIGKPELGKPSFGEIWAKGIINEKRYTEKRLFELEWKN